MDSRISKPKLLPNEFGTEIPRRFELISFPYTILGIVILSSNTAFYSAPGVSTCIVRLAFE